MNSKDKKIGLISATFLGVSSIIGSGWLFAPYKAAQAAGSGAIFSWIFGAIIVTLLALCFAEIAAIYPRRGLSAIIPTLSHNRHFGFPFALANWLGVVAVVSLEAEGTIQYLISLVPQWSHFFYGSGELTPYGLLLSSFLVILFGFFNFWGATLMTRTNNILSVLKLIIPVVVGLVFVAVAFHPKNFDIVNHRFITYGYQSIFTAILTTGIIVAFNGFQTVISFASEIKNPRTTIPVSVVLSIMIALVVYLLLQISFIGAVPSSMLTSGWKHLNSSAPLIELAGMLGLSMMVSVIYFGATVSPCGAAIAFIGSSTRMFTAMSRNQQMPKYFDHVHPVYQVSRRSLVINTLFSIVFVVLFRSWSQVAQVLGLFHIISYLPVPIALVVFRRVLKEGPLSLTSPDRRILAAILFVLFNYLFCMASVAVVLELMIIFAGLHVIFLFVSERSIAGLLTGLRHSFVLIIYFLSLLFLDWIAPNNLNWLSDGYFAVLVTCVSLGFFYLLTRTTENTKAIIESAINIYRVEK